MWPQFPVWGHHFCSSTPQGAVFEGRFASRAPATWPGNHDLHVWGLQSSRAGGRGRLALCLAVEQLQHQSVSPEDSFRCKSAGVGTL